MHSLKEILKATLTLEIESEKLEKTLRALPPMSQKRANDIHNKLKAYKIGIELMDKESEELKNGISTSSI